LKRIPEIVARFVQGRPWLFIGIIIAISIAAVPGITMLKTDSGYESMVSSDSSVFRDSERFEEQFGGDSITVLFTGDTDNVLSGQGLSILQEFQHTFASDSRILSILTPIESPPLLINGQSALVVVTPKGNLSDDETLQTVMDVEGFFASQSLLPFDVTVINDSKFVEALSSNIENSLAMLLGLSVAVMAIILFIMFRVRQRLISLFMVGIAVLWTFGLMGYISIPLSMATMAALPILFGLGIDYSIQFHNRYQEELANNNSVDEAIIMSMAQMFPVAGIALLATVIGFLSLFISDMPMVQDFGKVLLIGVTFSYMIALTLFFSIVYLSDRKLPVAKLRLAAGKAAGRAEKALAWLGRTALKNPLPILIVALLFGIAGGVFDRMLPTNTNIEELAPQDMQELVEIRQLRDVLDYDGEFRFMVETEDVTDTKFLQNLLKYQEDSLATYDELISANSPATLITETTGGIIPERVAIEAILAATPPLYIQQVISADRQMAKLSFTAQYKTIEEVTELLGQLQQDASQNNLSVTAVGSLALASQAVHGAVSTRGIINIIYLSAVFVVLLGVYRRLTSAILTVIPVGLVIAWTSLDMYLLGIPLNPMTAIMGVIIIGIGTEFMVLLIGRYQEEKSRGQLPREAMVTAISRIGRAIVTTAMTTLGGFAILIASDFVMISDFGITTVLSVFLCLVSAIAVMPPLIVWLDERLTQR
jgi:hydrophobe/amphiphile efflux-3 (HAE3) family protein